MLHELSSSTSMQNITWHASLYLETKKLIIYPRPRTLDDITCSSDTLTGADAQTLTSYITSHPFSPAKHLTDPIGYSLALRNADSVHFHDLLKERRLALGRFHMVVSELYCLRFGPIELPLFTVILHLIYAYPGSRADFLQLAEFLAKDCKVPVDAVDLSGASALMHAINTKPHYDVAFAEIMRNAGAKINRQDRMGRTAAHYIANVDATAGPAADKRACEAMRFFIANGGNTAVTDGEDVSVISNANKLKKAAPLLMNLLLGKIPTNLGGHARPAVHIRTLSMQATQKPNKINMVSGGGNNNNGFAVRPTAMANATRPTIDRAVSAGSVFTLASSGGSMSSVGSMKGRVELPGVTCACQRRGMWRICCGKPPDMEAMKRALA